MRSLNRITIAGVLLSTIPAIILEGFQFLASAPFTFSGLAARWIFCAGIIFLAYFTQLSNGGIILALLTLVTGIIYVLTQSSLLAWLLLIFYFNLLIWLTCRITSGRGIFANIIIYPSIALIAGLATTAFVQIDIRFSDEEFFAALQAIEIGILWITLAICSYLFWRLSGMKIKSFQPVNFSLVAITIVAFVLIGTIIVVNTYQNSFFPDTAPGFEGIDPENPFLCGQVSIVEDETYSGKDLFPKVLELVKNHPLKESPEYGMLALATKDQKWAERFRDSILEDANLGLFTKPANSVKYSQYEASLRAYYYPRVSSAFPNLFSNFEKQILKQWFSEINQRAHSIEWVDWMYAIAYNKRPQGPYENQDIGAGLLALLQNEGLNDPELTDKNLAYLAQNPRGWYNRFRNTDDAVVYQPEWLNNAFFQSLNSGDLNQSNLKKSFQWLNLQALPDGAPLRYNHIGSATYGNTDYQGAIINEDPTSLWISGRALDYALSKGEYLPARPGVDHPINLTGTSPTWGSCLIFGDSGLPNQIGPLAPDKIVFRDNWATDSPYLLVNLRFTGWHRYKATNTITLLYQGGPLVTEINQGELFDWLPVGRSLFRDKRVPRENLNGLLIEKTGISKVFFTLTGLGGPWSQDPPFYATIGKFVTGQDVDTSLTSIDGWHGWNHDREINFYHNGPIVVFDKAIGPRNRLAGINWHVNGDYQNDNRRIQLLGGNYPAEMLLLPITDEATMIRIDELQNESLQVQYQTQSSGQLSLVTIFLLEDWEGAEVAITQDGDNIYLEIDKGERHIKQLLE